MQHHACRYRAFALVAGLVVALFLAACESYEPGTYSANDDCRDCPPGLFSGEDGVVTIYP